MTITLQSITVYDPSNDAVRQASGIRRADTIGRIESLGGEAEEFRAAVRQDPNRIAPWVSKTGFTVVVFTPKPDPRDEWEPTAHVGGHGGGAVSAKRYRCTECGKESNAGGIALHIKSSGHSGSELVLAAEEA